MNLPTTRKLALKNKVVFGTGDYWCAPTVTANMAFVRAISQTGMSLFTIEHRPRALTADANVYVASINEKIRVKIGPRLDIRKLMLCLQPSKLQLLERITPCGRKRNEDVASWLDGFHRA
ncbi:hypothetical protein ACE6H2_017995 [Prunus campanulata]